MKLFDVVVPLDLCVDFIAHLGDAQPQFGQVETLIPDYEIELGGSAVIFASQAAKLGLRVAGIGRVGDDLLGHFILKRLKQTGINTDWVVVDQTLKTGVGIALSKHNDRAILTYSGSIDAVTPEDVTLQRLLCARHVHIASYFLMKKLQPHYPALLPELERQGVSVSLDTNWDPEGTWNSGLKALLPHITIFFPNRQEATAITGTTTYPSAREALRQQVPYLAVKNGSEGAEVFCGQESCSAAAIPVSVCDAIGAGDNFDAGFVYGLLKGFSLKDCLLSGTFTGGKSTEKSGGIAGQITEYQLLELLQNR